MSAEPPAPDPIRPLGEYYAQDEQGYVLNRCAPEKIDPVWRPLIASVVEVMREAWGEQLLGVYLRGSVPGGTAVPGLSDLDAVALLRWKPGEPFLRWESPDWARTKADALQMAFPLASAVELVCAHHDPAIPGQNPRVKMVLKTQSLCIWGEDVVPQLPPCRPGPDMMLHYRWLAGDLARYRSGELTSQSELRSLMKCLIRTGFELVMEREGRFATDLYPCVRSFARHHPEHAVGMEMALRTFLAPEAAGSKLPPSLDRLASWLEVKAGGISRQEETW